MKLPKVPKGKSERDRLVCKDGFSMSIQASENHYCRPKKNVTDSRYTRVEVGYPSEPEEFLTPYAEDPSKLTETIYPYVPVWDVLQVIKKHGGAINL